VVLRAVQGDGRMAANPFEQPNNVRFIGLKADVANDFHRVFRVASVANIMTFFAGAVGGKDHAAECALPVLGISLVDQGASADHAAH
jgi:hypothetical protein